jgi:hypothetical protein
MVPGKKAKKNPKPEAKKSKNYSTPLQTRFVKWSAWAAAVPKLDWRS